MITTIDEETALRESTGRLLHQLRFGVHRLGYRQLLLLVPCYAMDDRQSLSKELYPRAAAHFGYASWQPIEHAVRLAILDAWQRREPGLWEGYFPGIRKPPSNKQFIATLAEMAKYAPPM